MDTAGAVRFLLVFISLASAQTSPAAPKLVKRRGAPTQDSVTAKELADALAAMTAGDYPSARAAFASLASRFPARDLYLFNLANCDFMLKRYAVALENYRLVGERNGDLAVPARLYAVKTLRKMNRLGEAGSALDEVRVEGLPPNLAELARAERSMLADAHLARSTLLFENGKFNESLEAARASIALRQSDDAQMAVAMSLLKLNRQREARAELAKVKGAEYSEDVGYFARLIEQGRYYGSSPFTASIGMAGGADSNVFLDGSAPVSSPVTSTWGSAALHLAPDRKFSARLAYDGSWDESWSYETNRYVTHALELGTTYKTSTTYAQLAPRIGYDELGGAPYVAQAGAALRLEWRLSAWSIGVSGSVSRNYAQAADYAYLDGNLASGRAYASYERSSLSFTVGVSGGRDATGDLPLSSGGTLPLAHLNYGAFTSATYSFTPRFEGRVDLSYQFRRYDNALAPEGIERRDGATSARLRLDYQAWPRIGFFGSLGALLNTSTLGSANNAVADKNYTQAVGKLGVEARLFP